MRIRLGKTGRRRDRSVRDIVMDRDFMEIYNLCKPFTMVTIERCWALYNSVQYIIKNKIPGDFVECGVWKGGSAMLMALVLLRDEGAERDIWLYDTFAGMAEPAAGDFLFQTGDSAGVKWKKEQAGDANKWCYASLEEVKQNMDLSGYPRDRLVYVKGMIEQEAARNRPESIALLRLDTDWYESTKHEMVYLFPRLEKRGVLIVDDYGHWAGCRKAVDEYISEHNVSILLNRIDKNGVVGIK